MEPSIQYVTARDGVSIAYYAIGQGPPLLWLMSPWSHLEEEWRLPMLRAGYTAASQNCTLVRLDPRGLGLSDRDVEFEIEDLVLDIAAVVDRLGIEKFSLMAMGFSAFPGLLYTARHPERVVRFAQGPPAAAARDLGSERMDKLAELSAVDWELGSETIVRTLYADFTDEQVKSFAALVRSACDFATFERFLTRYREWDVSEEAARVTTPTLLLHMRDNPNFSVATTRRIAGLISNSQVLFATSTTDMIVRAIQFLLGVPMTGDAPMEGRQAAVADTAVVLFTDIADSTALTERLGDAAFRDAARALDDVIRRTMRETEGTPVEGKVLGDGVMGVFSSAARAIEAGSRCREASSEAELPLHVGIHAGDVIREDGNVFGGTVNIAARICGLSAPGEILVSDVVRGMARTSAGVAFDDRGEHTLKGINDAVRVYAVRESAT